MEETARLNAPPRGGIDSYTLKIIAIIGMAMDHIGTVFWDFLPPLARILLFAPGGLTFPIMAYLLTVGYRHTRNVKRYALRLFVFAAVSLVPFAWAFSAFRLNVLFTLLLGLLVIYLYDHMQNRAGFWLSFVGITLVSVFCDWNLIGVPMVLCYHTIQNRTAKVVVPVLIAQSLLVLPGLLQLVFFPQTWAALLPQMAFGLVGCTATIPLLLRYNGRRGRPMKYLFYGFYPAHLALLALLRALVFGVWW